MGNLAAKRNSVNPIIRFLLKQQNISKNKKGIYHAIEFRKKSQNKTFDLLYAVCRTFDSAYLGTSVTVSKSVLSKHEISKNKTGGRKDRKNI